MKTAMSKAETPARASKKKPAKKTTAKKKRPDHKDLKKQYEVVRGKPLVVATKKPKKKAVKPTDIQLLASELKKVDWHRDPNDGNEQAERQEEKIRRLVGKCKESEVRELWQVMAPTAKFPTPWGLKQIKTKEEPAAPKGVFNDPRKVYDRRKEMKFPDASGEVAHHDEIAAALAKGEILQHGIATIADYVFRGELITMGDVKMVLSKRDAARVASELERLQATRKFQQVAAPISGNGNPTVSGNVGAAKMKTKTNKTKQGMSALEAAEKVLRETGREMRPTEMIELMASKGYWTSPGGATPHATLYAAILVNSRKDGSPFVKGTKGHFALKGAKAAKSEAKKPEPKKQPAAKVTKVEAPKQKGGKTKVEKKASPKASAKGGKKKTSKNSMDF